MPGHDDLFSQPLSGMTTIDALLDYGPGWNYRSFGGNTLTYTFSITAGNEDGVTGQQAFSASQQAAVRGAFAYITQLTGIQFKETAVGSDADIHLSSVDLEDPATAGQCDWNTFYHRDAAGQVDYYAPEAWVYLDDAEWGAENSDLTAGAWGYETLLHELGHALGLKHPFEDSPTLDASLDNDDHTLMSYHEGATPKSAYGELDLAAFDWLYGRDGLRGALGVNSSSGGYYITGTAGEDELYGEYGDDVLDGHGGSDLLWGGAGVDTAVFSGALKDYRVRAVDGGAVVIDAGGTAADLVSIEKLRFSDGTVLLSDLFNDHGAPAAPTLSLDSAVHRQGYVHGSSVNVSGKAEPGSLVLVWVDDRIAGIDVVGANGAWSSTVKVFDGVGEHLHVTASDSAGNVSNASPDVVFSVDATPPPTPRVEVVVPVGSAKPIISGVTEPGAFVQVQLTSPPAVSAPMDGVTAGADGSWSVTAPALAKGNYQIQVFVTDVGGNNSYTADPVKFSVGTIGATAGTAGNDVFLAGPGAQAFDGGPGTDAVWYGGARADYTLAPAAGGFTVTDKKGDGGVDTLTGIERLKFADGWLALDVDGAAGEAYRLYRAAFDRPADAAGLGYWISRMEAGTALGQVAQEFMQQPEFTALYGKNPSDADFLHTVYHNVLHREADAAGFDFWMGALQHSTRADVLVQFSESLENRDQVAALIGAGMGYTPWH